MRNFLIFTFLFFPVSILADIHYTNPPGINNQNTLQSGATFFVSSGSISGNQNFYLLGTGGSGGNALIYSSFVPLPRNGGFGPQTQDALWYFQGNQDSGVASTFSLVAATVPPASGGLEPTSGQSTVFQMSPFGGSDTRGTFAIRINQTGQFVVNDASVTVQVPLVTPATTTINGVPYYWTGSQASGTKVLQNDGSGNLSWAAGSGGSVGGSNKQIQYNNNSSLGGAAGFQYQANASPNVSIQSQSASTVPFVVKGAVSQTANIQEWQDSNASLIANMSPTQFQGPNGSVIAGQGPGISFLSYPNDGIASNGQNLGFWEQGVLALNVTDTLKEFRLPSDYYYSWASATNNNAGSDTQFSRSSAGVIQLGNGGNYNSLIVGSPNSTTVGLTVRYIIGQTANLTEWKDNAGTTYAAVSSTQIRGPNGGVAASDGPGISFFSYPNDGLSSNGQNIALWQAKTLSLNVTDTLKEFRVPSNYYYSWSSASNNNSASDTQFSRSAAGVIQLGNGGTYNALLMGSPAATTVGLTVKGFASQSADLQEWQNSSGVVLSSITSSGVFTGNGSGLTNLQSLAQFSGALFVGLASGTTFHAFVPTKAITLKNASFTVDVAGTGGSGDTIACSDSSGNTISVTSSAAAAAGTVSTSATSSVNISAGTTVYMRLDSGAVTKPQGNAVCTYVMQ